MSRSISTLRRHASRRMSAEATKSRKSIGFAFDHTPCGLRHELAPIKQAFMADGTLPECRNCAGLVKAATISFGQAMPERAMARAQAAALDCDLFLVLGSSLVVYPAAGFPLVAKRNGARLVILNREPTAQDEYADLALHVDIGPTLGEAVGIA